VTAPPTVPVPPCSEVEGTLQAYLDSEVAPETRVAVDAHVRACPTCAEALADSRALRRMLAAGLRRFAPPRADFTARVLAALDAPAGPRPPSNDSSFFSGAASDEPSAVVITPPPPISPAAPASPGAAAGDAPSAPPPAPAAPQTGAKVDSLLGRTIGGCRIEDRIGAGGMGTVYRAVQISMGRTVALKILAPRLARNATYLQRFFREARAAARLNHPHMVRIYDVGPDPEAAAGPTGPSTPPPGAEPVYYQVLELVEGESLRERLRREGPIPAADAIRIATEVARALDHAARHGVIHRDVKPDNVLVSRTTGRALLADLGLARADEALGAGSGTLTVDGVIMGTPNYMSPEQARDTHAADHRSDLYSLGASLYHMLYGRAPYAGYGIVETISRVIRDPLAVPPPWGEGVTLPPGTLEVLRKMLARDPAERYASAADVVADLEAIAAGRPPAIALAAPPRAAPARLAAPAGSSGELRALRPRTGALPRESRSGPRERRRSPAGPLVGAIAVLLVAAAGTWWYKRSPATPGSPGARPPASPVARPDGPGSRPGVAPATPGSSDSPSAAGSAVAGGPAGSAAERPPDTGSGTPPASPGPASAAEGEPRIAAADAPQPADYPAEGEAAPGGQKSRLAIAELAAWEAMTAGDFERATEISYALARQGDEAGLALAKDLLARVEAARAEALVAADRKAATDAYRPRRLEILGHVAALRTDRARTALDAAAAEPTFAPIVEREIARDRQDVALVEEAAARAHEALRARADKGETVRLALRDGGRLEGALRRNEETLLVSTSGEVRTLVLADLSPEEVLAQAARAPGPWPLAARARAALQAANGEAEAALAAAASLGDPVLTAHYRGQAAVVAEVKLASLVAARLAEADKLAAKVDDLVKRRRLADAEKAGRDALDLLDAIAQRAPPGSPEAAQIAERRTAAAARFEEVRAEIARAEAGKDLEVLLARLFRAGKAKALPDGRVEVTYDFTRVGVEPFREDWRVVEVVKEERLAAALKPEPAVPTPFDRVRPLDASEHGVVAHGYRRLVWRGRLKGEATLEVAAVPLLEQNAILTLCDEGEDRFYMYSPSYVLPALPEVYRPRFPEMFALFDPYREPRDYVGEMVKFPDFRQKGSGGATALAPRKLVRLKAERLEGANKASRLLLTVGSGRPLEGIDDLDPRDKGGVGLAAWNSAVIFRSAKITGRLDPDWLENERRRHGAPGGAGGEKRDAREKSKKND